MEIIERMFSPGRAVGQAAGIRTYEKRAAPEGAAPFSLRTSDF